MNDIVFTVLTPTYNRAHTLKRVFDSLCSQSYKNFEWIVVDDGSTDNTKQLVQQFSLKADFPVKFFFKPNGGKHSALNYGFQKANGELILVFDSDDWCVPFALERFKQLWDNISEVEKDDYSGISVLKIYQNGLCVGDKYPESQTLNTYIDRYNMRIKGDKWELIRRDICNQYLYIEIPQEKYLAPSFQWLLIGQKYKTFFSNDQLSIVEYLEDGISKNSIAHRAGNPKGACQMYKLQYKLARTIILKMKSITNYYRFFFHGGPFKLFGLLSIIGIVSGFSFYLYDKLILKMRYPQSN